MENLKVIEKVVIPQQPVNMKVREGISKVEDIMRNGVSF